MKGPLVSIIMPVHNAQMYLAGAIESVLGQDHSNWELIIVDDGSSDGSLSIARSYNDVRIKVFSQSNKGVANARNFGLRTMAGDYFCFLDADDILTANSLSLRLRCFDFSNVTFADGSVEIFDRSMRLREKIWIPEQPKCLVRSLIRLDGKCFFGPTWMVRRQREIEYRFMEGLTHGEDLLFYMTYAHLGDYAFVNGVVLKYRRSYGSAMTNLWGLAQGYNVISRRLKLLSFRVSSMDELIFDIRRRKIMFLSFLSRGHVRVALKYLLLGKV